MVRTMETMWGRDSAYRLASPTDGVPAPTSPTDREPAAIEVVLPSGGRVLIRRDTPVAMLRAVIAALRE
jgi:hypothetical protein